MAAAAAAPKPLVSIVTRTMGRPCVAEACTVNAVQLWHETLAMLPFYPSLDSSNATNPCP